MKAESLDGGEREKKRSEKYILCIAFTKDTFFLFVFGKAFVPSGERALKSAMFFRSGSGPESFLLYRNFEIYGTQHTHRERLWMRMRNEMLKSSGGVCVGRVKMKLLGYTFQVCL